MSIQEIEKAIFQLRMNDERVTAAGHCRYAVSQMAAVARQADVTPPLAEHMIMASRIRISAGDEDVQYSFRARTLNDDMIWNLVKDTGYPVYCGPFAQAPGLLKNMKRVEEII